MAVSSAVFYVVQLNLTGWITTAATARMRTPPIMGPTKNFDPGLITVSTSARLRAPPSSGRSLAASAIKTTSAGRLAAPTVGQSLIGRISTTATMRLDRPWGLVGQIKTTSSGFLINLPPPDSRLWLSGRITTQSTGRFRSPPNAFFAGRIKTVAQARIARPGEMLAAKALTVSSLSGDALHIGIYFKGRIKTTWWAGISPTAAILSGQISMTSFGHIRSLPLLPTEPPPVCTLDVKLDDYLDLITSEHIGKPLYVRSVITSLQPYVDDQLLATGMPCSFDVDIAVGEQLDFTGQWIGKTRFVNLPDVFFSWDAHGLGWDQANWQGPFDLPEALLRPDDEHYRLSALCDNRFQPLGWQHPPGYQAWDMLFAGTGYQVMILRLW